MRCLYCGKRLALLRKLTDSDFCSSLHRRLYQQEQEKMALARLVEGQRRFATLLGVPVREYDEPAPEPQAQPENEIPSFLPQEPLPQALPGIRLIESASVEQVPAMTLPPYEADWLSGSGLCGRLPLLFAMVEPKTGYWGPRGGYAPFKCLGATYSPMLRVQPAARILVAPILEWSWRHEPLATVARLCGVAEPLVVLVSPAEPVLVVARLWQPGVPAESAPIRQPEVMEAAFESTVALASPGDSLQSGVQASQDQGDAVHQEQVHRDRAPEDAPAAFAVNLLPLAKPGSRAADIVQRRPRPRELFFPLPRLSDLPSMAFKVAAGNSCFGRVAAIRGAAWNPSALIAALFGNPFDNHLGKGAEAFDEIRVEFLTLETLPRLAVIPGPGPELRRAERTQITATALTPAGATLVCHSPACDTENLTALQALLPAARVRAASPELTPAVLVGITGEPARGEMGGRSSHVTASEARAQAPSELPMYSAGPSVPRLALDECTQMSGLPQSGAPARLPGLVEVQPQPVFSEPEVIPVAAPASAQVMDFRPARAATLYPLTPGEPAAHDLKAIARAEISSLWPEPPCLIPRLKSSIAEDAEVREAVRAMAAVMEVQAGSFLAKLKIPLPSLHFPRPDTKWLVMSIPAILLLGMYSLTNRGPEPVAARQPDPAAGGNFLTAQMDGLQQSILHRAAISLSDDFRSGLGEWEGRGDWSNAWSYDAAGFLITGPLALYQPSMSMTDYRMEFLGQIEKKSIGWVFRAKDFDNYYAVRISLQRGGPLPVAIIERYAVIAGKEEVHTRRPLPLQVHTDTLYRVRMDVRGNGFTLSVQGQVVDHWGDDRLKSGGIGFFSAKGEQARLRWVEVSHQYDFLGRLCAFLAPYSLPAREGSLKQ
ncbi:MAG: hypothetical protein HY235_18095 [Acidobacteria bacterium]|nr:hypothetical protein [Acidobacteriota bacterium]